MNVASDWSLTFENKGAVVHPVVARSASGRIVCPTVAAYVTIADVHVALEFPDVAVAVIADVALTIWYSPFVNRPNDPLVVDACVLDGPVNDPPTVNPPCPAAPVHTNPAIAISAVCDSVPVAPVVMLAVVPVVPVAWSSGDAARPLTSHSSTPVFWLVDPTEYVMVTVSVPPVNVVASVPDARNTLHDVPFTVDRSTDHVLPWLSVTVSVTGAPDAPTITTPVCPAGMVVVTGTTCVADAAPVLAYVPR
jgi:hypothetical protein